MKCVDCFNAGVINEVKDLKETNIVCGMCNKIIGDMEDCTDYINYEEVIKEHK